MSTLSQRSFSSGEIAPALYGRVDYFKHATGLRTCRNNMVMRHGGTSNRPGTQFVAEVKDSSDLCRLVKFAFNAEQTYILEFGDQYMRVIRDGAQETDAAKTITGVTTASPAVFTSVAHGYNNGDEIYLEGLVGFTPSLNGRNYRITNKAANTYELLALDGSAVNTTGTGTYSSGGSTYKIYEITTPYAHTDLSLIQYIQSADVITLVHPSYAPRELSRTGHTSWTLSTITFAPSISAPTGVTNSGAAGSTTEWVVTAVAEETLEESLASSSTGSSAIPSSGTPIVVSWSAVTGAQEYNVYKKKNGIYGYIGTAGGTSFSDNGITADTSDSHPRTRNPFGSSDNYPSAVTYYQQRLVMANTNNDPEKIWTSKTGSFHNFTVSIPTQDDDAVTFTMAGRQVNSIKHLLDLGQLIVFTSAGEWIVTGSSANILVPGEVNPKQQTYNGSSYLSPIIIGGTALYVQGRGAVVRDLGFDYSADGYRGNDLTIFSSHLIDGYELVDWDYQQIPHSVVWMARDDGTLLGLTYVREQQILGWHKHDFDGTVENVACISEGDEDSVYLVIKRTIDSRTVRYIEKFATRRVDDIKDCVFMDSSLSYDGRNTSGSHTMTLSTASDWLYTTTMTLTSSAAYFSAAEVGNAIHLTGADGEIVRFVITGYTSTTVVTGKPHKTVPTSLRATATATWSRAVDAVSGLWHLEGKEVSVLGDGYVVASPNNEAYEIITVTDGAITLDKRYSVIHVGLPYISDLQTLDVDTDNGETLADKKKLFTKLTVLVEKSRGVWAGGNPPADDTVDPIENLTELKIRSDEGYDDPVDLETGQIDINILPEWNSHGRVFIRQIDPLPLSVLSIAPAGLYPQRGGA